MNRSVNNKTITMNGRAMGARVAMAACAITLAIVTSPDARAQTLACATLSYGGGVLPDGSILIVGQPYVGTMSSASYSIEVGVVHCLAGAVPPPDLLPEPDGREKQRFVSFVVPVEGGGQETALRMTLVSLYDPGSPFPVDPPDLSAREGEVRYLNLLRDDLDAPVTSCLSSPSNLTFYRCATLGCNPEYVDWAELFGGEVIHLSGTAIVPDSSYSVAQLSASCAGSETTCAAVSAELELTTARYGDVDVGGATNVTDIVLTVDVVKDVAGAEWEYQCYVRSESPEPHNQSVNVTDIVLHVDALKLVAYPFAIPVCP